MTSKKLNVITNQRESKGKWKANTEHHEIPRNYFVIDQSYYKPTNQCKGELECCWWKGLPLSNVHERDLFLSGPNSLMVFEREMIDEIEKPIRERLRQGECQDVETWNTWTMNKKIKKVGRAWSDLFFSQ